MLKNVSGIRSFWGEAKDFFQGSCYKSIMKRIIEPVNLEGLSETGREQLLRETYRDHEKTVFLAYVLLIVAGGLGAHRFYLGHTRIALGFIALTLFVFVSSFWPGIDLVAIFILIFVLLFELFTLSGYVTKYNEALAKQLDLEINSHAD